MRVLITTTSGRGHFQPMFPLVCAMECAGHEVRWACAAEVCLELRENGFDVRPAGVYDLDPSPLRDPPPEIAEEWRPHILVCEQGELAGPVAAARLGGPECHPRVRAAAAGGARRARGRGDGRCLARTRPRAAPYAGTYDHLCIDIYPPGLQVADTPMPVRCS